MYDVEAPSKAMTHIQKIAPGPPKAIAVAVPAMLPTPMRPDSEIDRACHDDTPAADFSPFTMSRSISPKPRICMKRVRIENHSPTPRHRPISARLQITPLMEFRISSTGFPRLVRRQF